MRNFLFGRSVRNRVALRPWVIALACFALMITLNHCAGKNEYDGQPWLEAGYRFVQGKPGEHQFRVEIEDDEFLRVRVEQDGLDGLLRLYDRHERLVAEVDSPSGPWGPELLLARGTGAGPYVLELKASEVVTSEHALDGTPAAGASLRLLVEHLGPGTNSDQALLEARRVLEKVRIDESSVEDLRCAIDTLPESADILEVARLRQRLGLALKDVDRLEEAVQAFASAQPPIACLTSNWELASSLNAHNSALVLMGRFDEVEPRLEYAKEVWSQLDYAPGLSVVWNDVGVLHAGRGELPLAVTAYQKALELASSPTAEATISRNITRLKMSMGLLEKSVQELSEHVVELRESGDAKPLALALSSLASAFSELSEREEDDLAQRYLDRARKAYDEAESLQALQPATRGLILQERAGFVLKYGEKSDAHQALEDLHHSRRLLELDEREQAFLSLREAEAYRRLGQLEMAEERIAPASAFFEKLGIRHGSIAARVEKARILRAAGSPELAREEIAEALDLAECMRRSLHLGRHREAQHDAHYDLFFEAVDLLADMDERAGAFDVAERSLGRSFLDALAAPVPDSRLAGGADEIDALVAEKVRAKRDGHLRLADELADEITQRLNNSQYNEEALLGSLPEEAPELEPLRLAEIQSHLGDDTTLLTFVLGDERSWLLRVTEEEVDLIPRGPRGRLEGKVERALQTLESLSPNKAPEEWLLDLEDLAADLLAGVKLETERLAIVPTGELLRLPFGVLPKPGADSLRILLAEHEIVRLPSASALVYLRQRAAGRPAPSGLLGLIADPVFGEADERVHGEVSQRGFGETEEQVRGIDADSDDGGFPRLRQSGKEADKLLALTDRYQVTSMRDFKADREAFLENLGDYRWLHIATHTDFDPEHPEQMGLVVSLVGPDGRERPGLVRHQDIGRLDLAAELVTLAACESALGDTARGENVSGLTRSFFAAGATRLVATLWPILDKPETAELMEHFYRGMLAGKAPPTALRAAQLEAASRGVPPRVWAAFVHIGPWDPLAPLPQPAILTAESSPAVP